MRARILFVEDDAGLRRLLAETMVARGYEVASAGNGEEALTRLEMGDVDVMVTDFHMPGMDGLALCRRVTEAWPDIPVIVLTAFGSLETAVGAIRSGAYDFVTKPVELDALALSVSRAVERRGLKEEVRRLRAQVSLPAGDVIGESPILRKAYAVLERVADAEVPVLVLGETGTGKELAARALHDRSRRRNGPFLAVNAAAVPETLLESELFGHTRGAFTGAQSARKGLFQRATGGTLFLDEVGELPLATQPKLLRALQEKKVRPVGSDEEVAFDARIVAATHRDLQALVEQGRFRPDLLYRLDVVSIELPPLRARGNDVLLLAREFLRRAAASARKPVLGLSPEAARKLLDYAWPGNVRELQNCLERAVALARYDIVTVEELPKRIQEFDPRTALPEAAEPSTFATLDEVERRYIERVLEASGGNQSSAARVLGIDRKTLHRKLAGFADESIANETLEKPPNA
ncbi:MAG TPA: sigma-54 dependent transcriptional regulator [Myxococcales bacterium]|nr:sigma-54 dependent transcriptional regulator [Myxococcales bacterium]